MANEIIVVLISAITGGLITFLITKHFRQKKSLAYQIVSKMSLINVRPEVRHKIKIDYDGTSAENIFSFKVRVINDGNVPIKNQPILFEFDKKAKVLVADYNTKPRKEFGEITRANSQDATNEAKFIIGLLNPKRMKEQIEFNFITVDNKNDNLEVISRGENLRFHELAEPRSRFLGIPGILWSDLMPVFIGASIASFLIYRFSPEPPKLIILVCASIFVVLMFAWLLRSVETRVRDKRESS